MPHPLAPYAVAGALLAAPAPQTFFADGFAGAWTRGVTLSAGDAVTGCRATAPVGAGRTASLERRRGWPETVLALQGAGAARPAAVIAGGVRHPTPPRHDGDAPTAALTAAAEAALARAADPRVEIADGVLALPADGLAATLARLARCG
jgi:hypothetical protein